MLKGLQSIDSREKSPGNRESDQEDKEVGDMSFDN